MAKSRRPNGTGSVKIRNGKCQISVMVGRKPDGKRLMKYFTGKNQTEARKKLKDYMDARENGMNMEADFTLEEWSRVFMEVHAPNLKPVTIENYNHTLKLINKHLGSRKLRELKPMDIEWLLLRLRDEGRSDSAISQVRGLLYQMFEKAVGNDLVRKNIVQYAQKLRKRAPNEKESFTEEEVAILLEHLPLSKIGMGIRLLLGCGLRSQELLALMKKHIEPDGSWIYIRQAVSQVHGEVIISEPKSYKSYRNVPVPPNLQKYAIALRETEGMFIFQSPTCYDKPINPTTFRKYYRAAIESVPGVRYLSAHACRHTCASILHAQGVDPYTLQSILGHTTLDMTHHYTHVHPDTQKEAAGRFAKVFSVTKNVSQQEALEDLIADAEKIQQDFCHSGAHSEELEPR